MHLDEEGMYIYQCKHGLCNVSKEAANHGKQCQNCGDVDYG